MIKKAKISALIVGAAIALCSFSAFASLVLLYKFADERTETDAVNLVWLKAQTDCKSRQGTLWSQPNYLAVEDLGNGWYRAQIRVYCTVSP